MSRGKRRGRVTSKFLLPFNRFQTGTADLRAGMFVGLPTGSGAGSRPMRPHSLELRYASATPVGIRFRVYAGDGEEIYQSPSLISGLAPQLFRVKFPTGTDFAYYTNTADLIEVTGEAVTFAIRLLMELKDNYS